MIRAEYDRENHKLTVKGHAETAVHGQDLLCAAVSTLVLTLAQSIDELNENGFLTGYTVKLEPGDCEISCTGDYHRCCKLVFDVIWRGLRLLEEQYPNNIDCKAMWG